MFYYLTASILILSMPSAILAIECFNCNSDVDLNSTENINTTNLTCTSKDEPADVCSSLLMIDLQYKNGSVNFMHLPNQVLTFSNGRSTTIITTTIWLSKEFISQSAQFLNQNGKAIEEDVNKIYSASKLNIS